MRILKLASLAVGVVVVVGFFEYGQDVIALIFGIEGVSGLAVSRLVGFVLFAALMVGFIYVLNRPRSR